MSSSLTQMIVISVYAGAVLLVAVVVRLLTTDQDRRGLPSSFVKLYGLVSLAGFALLLVALDGGSDGKEIKTAAFTLLGIIAGYLAGSPNEGKEENTIVYGKPPSKDGEGTTLTVPDSPP